MKLCPYCETGFPDSETACPTHGGLLSEIRDLKPGMLIRRTYRILRKLGQGGMGAVYLARHELMDAPRALKFLSNDLANDEAFTRRFLREGRMLRQIRHRNVVECGDLERAEDETLFFAMEFVDGPDLRGLLASAAGPLEVAQALAIARGIADGLGAAHRLGMVHRDIKPENVLMAREPANWMPKIADFGIVATVENSTVYKTTRGSLLTPPYAAPEQWRGMRAAELDGRTDLYALGGVLFEMLTGQTVFDAENYEGWFFEHLNTPPTPPSRLRPELAEWSGLDALVLCLLAKDRADRPADVAEVLGMMDALQHNAPVARRLTLKEDERRAAAPPQPPKLESMQQPTGEITRLSPELKPVVEVESRRRGAKWVPEAIIVAVVLMVFFFSWQDSRHREAARSENAASTNAETQPQDQAAQPDFAAIEQQALALYSEKNYKLAAPLFAQACDGGNGDGCFYLGKLYRDAEGLGKDSQKAAALIEKACSLGQKDACAAPSE